MQPFVTANDSCGVRDCRQAVPSAAAAGSPYLQQLYAAAASPYMHPNILGLAGMGSGEPSRSLAYARISRKPCTR
jgi:hypothetical protein